jgi:catechol 2,3-dioxygenase-like lactoylglutathione lyase family enzyme
MAVAPSPSSDPPGALASVYTEVCTNHRAIADFRAKLLALLPTVSGAAIFVLLARDDTDTIPLAAIGLFGFAVTFGLFMYDLRGIQDCVELRRRAPEIEAVLGVERAELSVFRGWPSSRVLGLADEVGAGWIVYTAVLGSWLYLAGRGSSVWDDGRGLLLIALYVLLLIAFVVWFGPRIRDAGQVHGGAAGARRWEHSALAVADLDDALVFYERAFGYRVVVEKQEMSAEMADLVGAESLECHLAQLLSPISDHVLELVQFRKVPPGIEERGPTRPGMGHLSFVVGDLDTALTVVERLGGSRVGKITPFSDGRRVYCRDRSGTTIELAEPVRPSAK